MASANIKELTDANFEAEVLKSEVPTLVDFWEWRVSFPATHRVIGALPPAATACPMSSVS